MTWILRTNSFKQTTPQTEIITCTKKEALTQALKKLGLFWTLALFSVFIPVLHFFLVPAFLIVGVVSFLRQNKNTHFLKTATCICPACEKSFALKNIYFEDTCKINCELCAESLTILSEANSLN